MANGKGSARRPLSRCTDQELAAEWTRIFGRKARPANRRSVINRLFAAGDKKRLTPEEFVEHRRAFLATQPDLGINRDLADHLADCGISLEGDNVIVGFDPAKGDDVGMVVERTQDGTVVSVTELPRSVPAADMQAAPAVVAPAPRPFRKYGRKS